MKESIGQLPEEIQAFILSKLNGRSAAVCKKVCKLWHELIEGLESCMHFWLRCCLKEIPMYTLVEYTRLMQLSGGREATLTELALDWMSSLGSKLPWMFWREVYAEFYRTTYIMTREEKKTELHFYPLHGEVSCLHVQDNVVYSGHDSGLVMSWENVEADLHCETLYRHHRRVTYLTGLDMVTTTNDILNGETSNIIVSSSKDANLMLYNLETETSSTINHYTKQINCVSTWGRHLVAAADRCFIQGQPLWKVDKSDLSVGVTCTLFSQSASDITAVAFWEETVLSGDEMGNLFQWSGCLQCRQEGNQDMTPVANLQARVKAIFIQGSKIICFTSDNCLHISQYKSDSKIEFDKLNIHTALMKTAEFITVRGPILAIGCKSGFVYLYHIPKPSDWDNLLLEKPAHILQFSKDHIHSIAIGDDGSCPYIVVATEDYCINIVQFKRRRKNSENAKVD
ncbi:uncharacterized protein LOC128226637 isoform X2 [Mya arenaria]|nr:uncharacterized protein LOC128226637 isoform X2 [Mya arenaria]XP_052792560.1 uncharacterized protein LOC128226637 isoform X2 [Mya arenaria]